VLIDYYGREYSDALDICRWWYNEYLPRTRRARKRSLCASTRTASATPKAGLRKIDRGRVALAARTNEYEAVRYVMGEEASTRQLNIVKDRVRKVLFGTGVSVAAVITAAPDARRERFNACKIVGHPGFNLFKCRYSPTAGAPFDVVARAPSSRRTSTTLSPRRTSSCTTASGDQARPGEALSGAEAVSRNQGPRAAGMRPAANGFRRRQTISSLRAVVEARQSMLFPTPLVGVYPQPEWLIDRKKLAGRFRARAARRSCGASRCASRRGAARRDAARDLAQEEAGLDIITDARIRRESTPTVSPPPSKGWTSTIPGTAPGPLGTTQPGAAYRRERLQEARRSKWTICASCARTRTKW